MTLVEFSDLFDVHFNNITSNQAPGLTEYEKSVFLTKAQDEIVKNYFTANSKGNNIGQGYDDSAKRQADFSVLMKTASASTASISGSDTTTVKKYVCTDGSNNSNTTTLYGGDITFSTTMSNGTYTVTSGKINTTITVTGFPYSSGQLVISDYTITSSSGMIDDRSNAYSFPPDVFIVINETLTIGNNRNSKDRYQIIPLRYDEYTRLMSKPFKRPLKNQAWRLINKGTSTGTSYTKFVEIITPPGVSGGIYNIRYIRKPEPIIVGSLDGLTIAGRHFHGDTSVDGSTGAPAYCELDPILHEDILQRAVELAKVSWTATGQDNAQLVMTAGQRSE